MIKILDAAQVSPAEILARTEDKRDISGIVAGIIRDVRQNGDAALLRYAMEFDRAELEALEVPREQMDQALADMEPDLRDVLEEAAENIRAFHRRQVQNGFIICDTPGVVLGQKVTPIEKIGVYIPGGTAPLPSTVLMDCIPAKIAGCPELVMVSPPTCGGDISPAILAAARIAGADRVFRCGGAQAIAALAYGTETVPRVDKIVGPGNAFVAEAKRQVFGIVGIDMIAGPSDILVIADGSSSPRPVAADLLSQAEHDSGCAVLVTDSPALARAAARELERQLAELPTEETARASLEKNGKIVLVKDIPEAVRIANALAPEHLELCVDNPFDYLEQVKNAGSIFLGRSTPEAVGDYFGGTNHTLPTYGTARFSSALSVEDFVKKSQFTCYSGDALAAAAEKIARFARLEGLEAHARSALIRGEGESI
ncbi:MAG: histidinol dehydrogenase [Oscillospiraceae bacterium]|jgi:histidinol dehydrogenase|nr:histidinol dehydrogenase [Oscillospiraceae bacterium]